MPLRRALRGALVALALAGCECAAAPTASPTRAPDLEAPRPRGALPPMPEPAPEPAPEPESIPRASRTDLPLAVPALTLTITGDAVELDSAPLVATWPPLERERVPEAAIHVRAEVAGPSPGYRIPELAAGFERMTAADRARAGAAISPSAFAVRAAPSVPWRRVVDAIYSGASSGWSEPRFVLRGPDGREVFLAMPAPRSVAAPASPAEAAPLHVAVTGSRTVRVSIGSRPLAPGCGSVHDAPADVLPSLAPEPLARCLDAARGAGPAIAGARFSSEGTIPFGELVPVLEALRARHDVVELAAPR